jgi:hypothetical protein
MTDQLKQAIEDEGWTLECESPLEIRSIEDTESFASGYAAQTIIDAIQKRLNCKNRKPKPKAPPDASGWSADDEPGQFGWL